MGDKKQEEEIDRLLGQVASDWLIKLGRVDPDEAMRQVRGMMSADELEEFWEKIGAIQTQPTGEDVAAHQGPLFGDLGRKIS